MMPAISLSNNRYVKFVVGGSKHKTSVKLDEIHPAWDGLELVFRKAEDQNRRVGNSSRSKSGASVWAVGCALSLSRCVSLCLYVSMSPSLSLTFSLLCSCVHLMTESSIFSLLFEYSFVLFSCFQ